MSKSITTLGGAMAVLLWFTGPAWAPRDCGQRVGTKPGGKSVVNPSDKAFKAGKGGTAGQKGIINQPAVQKSQKVK